MGAPSPSPDASGVMAIGAVLDGRYRIDGVLGKGGMGSVYKGEHTGIGRAVAIKILHSSLGRNKEATQRFQREALASGRLDHPNIVGVSDFGVCDDGSLYLVMEALEGEPLGARLEREKRIPWLEAVTIMKGVLAGLRHAHDKGVVHRDIKPDNIFLARKDGEQIIKILDFGIAKLYAGNADDPAMTRAGLTVGTPAYLSPEQAVGGEIKPATDLYSTSVVLYEMLSGRAPYEEMDPLAMLTAHVSKEPPTFAQIAPDVQLPAGLEAVVRHGLAKISGERIASATDYIEQLDAVLRAAGYDVPTATPRLSTPLPIPSGQYAAMATPMPFAADPGSAPTASLSTTTPPPTRAPAVMRTSVHIVGAPIPKKWIVIAGVLLAAAIVGAITLIVAGGHHSESSEPTPTGPIAVPVPVPVPTPIGETPAEREIHLKAALHDLETGKTCADRKLAVEELVQIGDARAIPDLKRARHRYRGGVLGIGDSDTNSCLTKDADDAIKSLGGDPKQR